MLSLLAEVPDCGVCDVAIGTGGLSWGLESLAVRLDVDLFHFPKMLIRDALGPVRSASS